ncbi:hypothetical protein [Mucilaginibacter ginsenosidivorans]|uniref:hypothetical protein n=1 Tax=Mucilaginibacter ginsenosidivorans TaxID=398053 RepID=UPI002938E902|nr:hypothetical protein [Mucilaginibacter ginsenosidivorans]
MRLKNIVLPALCIAASAIYLTGCSHNSSVPAGNNKTAAAKKDTTAKKTEDTVAAAPVTYAPINHAQYDSLMKKLAHGDTSGLWPVKNTPYPLPGAILPYKRVVAFYGNLYAKKWVYWANCHPKKCLPS